MFGIGLVMLMRSEIGYRFFKWLGISNELQIGDKQLDRWIYFITDNELIIKAIKKSPELQLAILEVINFCNQHGFKLNSFSCQGGRIWMQLSRTKSFKNFSFPLEELAEKFVPTLKKVADELDAKIIPSVRTRDLFLIKAAAILSISTGSAFYAGSVFIAHHIFGYSQLIKLKPLIIDAAFIGLGMVILMSAITIKLLGKTSRAHLVLIEVIFVGFFSFTASASFLIGDINADYDSSESHLTDVVIYNKNITHGRRSGTRHWIYLDNGSERYDVRVSPLFYSKVEIGDKMCVEEKDGFLGYRWIKNVYRVSCSYYR
jgi:hypothetical protein